jgi:hypothetical protein
MYKGVKDDEGMGFTTWQWYERVRNMEQTDLNDVADTVSLWNNFSPRIMD